jgi:hypothetical protein
MSREITNHRAGGLNELVTVEAVDQPGDGGANHHYVVTAEGNRTEIRFQNGPVKEAGVNGLTNEALLAIVEDRLDGFDKGKFASDDNANALDFVRQALRALKRRTEDRVARGVEGTHQA